ncbi:non-ribosomal peptide synthetase [Paenibacillus sp. EKM211P]|nr:non-ribosomal peptide synthetase [Paenibacillus sp. EKM211P]KAF6583001.1 amino acid adenylation domain-containing protein [Paenibacillus sp. EKM211P]
MIEHDIYQKFSKGQLKRDEALELLLQTNRAQPVKTELTEGQKGLWLECQMSPESYAYHTPGALFVSPKINLQILQLSLEYMVSFHKVLRTVMVPRDEEFFPLQQTEAFATPVIKRVPIIAKTKEDLTQQLWVEIKKPFNFEDGPLFRVSLYDVEGGNSILLCTFHHIVLDGISSQIFMNDLKTCYDAIRIGDIPLLQARRADYSEYIQYEQNYLKSEKSKQDRNFWLDKLSKEAPSLELPVIQISSSVPSYEGTAFSFSIDGELLAGLKSIATSKPVTLFSTMMAAYQWVLSRFSNQHDISIGTPVAGRPDIRFENVIGHFMNMIVIRSEVDGHDTFLSLIEKVQQTVLLSIEHSQYPYYRLVRDFQQLHSTGKPILFQAAFYFQNWIKNEPDDMFLEPIHSIHQLGEFDLTLEVIEHKDGCLFHLKYNPELYSAKTIESIASCYVRALEAIGNQIHTPLSDISLLSKEESQTILYEWNDTRIDFSQHQTFLDLFINQVKKSPDSVAVVCQGESLTYVDVFQRAKQIALFLRMKGVVKGSFVGIYLERTLDLLPALIGVQMSGGVYIPLDPAYPQARLSDMFKESSLYFVLTHSSIYRKLPKFDGTMLYVDSIRTHPFTQEELEPIESVVSIAPEDPVYLIFTSGSTGKPKGIIINHRGLSNFLCSMAQRPGCTSEDMLLAVTTICFDIAGLELYLPLIVGGKLEIATEEIQRDGIRLLETLSKGDITIMQATPATWKMLLAAGWNTPLNLKILCGGEPLRYDLSNRLLQLSSELWNMYGPTETTIWSSIDKMETGRKITIGRPIANTQFYVLDAALKPVPIGMVGELYIGGDGVATGYLNRDEETKQSFLTNPFLNDFSSKIYKTGDQARYLQDGTVECLGRLDHQVKIRGFRIEIGEVEDAIQQVEGISQAIVVVREEGDDKQLTAFLIPDNQEHPPDISVLREEITCLLPSYMLPALFVYVTGYPMTPNQKVNRTLLISMDMITLQQIFGIKPLAVKAKRCEMQQTVISRNPSEALQGLVERQMVCFISDMKKLPPESLDVHANFGSMGFDSISFTSLSVAINKHYDVKTMPTLFYTYSTIHRFAHYLSVTYFDKLAYIHCDELSLTTRQGEKESLNESCSAKSSEIKYIASPSGEKDIAIIGISGKLPGSPDLGVFWNNIIKEKDLITEIPADRWDWTHFYDKSNEDPNKSVSKWGGFISDIDKFDASFFGISPREAELMDPQQRMMLETVWETIENAGYKASDLAGSNTGVFIGATSSDYAEILMREHDIDSHTLSGIAANVISNRISYFYDLKGPSELLNTACSSSLVSVNRAVEAIRSGACDTAFAGGVNLILSPFAHVALSKINMLSKDGRCKAFDSSANGYVRGEGCAVIYLKHLSKAVEDGDHIYAVIKGSAVNHGGKTNSLTAPSSTAQCDLIRRAFHDAGFDPTSLGYLEAHGTGTALGDPIELDGMLQALSALYEEWGHPPARLPHCGVGSVKTNIGHLEAMAGLAGLIKVVLSLYYKQIPGNLHRKELNPYISLDGSPLYLIGETQAWTRLKNKSGNQLPLRGGVSSFGFGGTNAHVLLEEYSGEPQEECTSDLGDHQVLIVLSAKQKKELEDRAKQLLSYLYELEAHGSPVKLESIAYTLQIGREPMRERLAMLVSDVTELKVVLDRYIKQSELPSNVYTTVGTTGMESIFDDGELDEIVTELVERRQGLKLAKLWVNGYKLNWNLLYSNGVPNRVPLPTYPFRKESHWITVRNSKPQYGTNRGNLALNSMLDEVLLSKSIKKGLVFRKLWSVSDAIVGAHIVNGECVFPGTGYLEMVIQVAERIGKATAWHLKNIYWLQPLIIHESTVAEVLISMQEEDDGYCFQIESITPEGIILHSKGSIVLETADHQMPTDYVSIDDIRRRCPYELTKKRFYEQIAEGSGIAYGPYFQAMEMIYYSEKEALGQIHLKSEFENELSEYNIHPVLMDSVLQAMGCLFNQNTEKGVSKLPFSAEHIHVMEPLRACDYYVYAINRGKDIHDLALLDQQGKICVSFHNLSSREVKEKRDAHLFVPQWVAVEDVHNKEYASDKYGKVLVVSSNKETNLHKLAFIKALQYHGLTVIEAQLGEKTSMSSPEDVVLGYNDVPSYKAWLEDQEVRYIFFLTDMSNPLKQADFLHWDEEQNTGLMALFYLSKALSSAQEIRMITVTNGLFEVVPGEEISPLHAGISGFLKGASLEYPSVSMLLVDLPATNSKESAPLQVYADVVVKEMLQGTTGEVAVRGGKRYIRRLIKLDLPFAEGSAIRHQGVYWIAGAGGIGFELALYLASTSQARLILMGRSPQDEEMQKKLELIRQAGGEAQYIQTDITDPNSIRQTLEQTKLMYGSVHGVFHTAMVLQDMRIGFMNEDTFKKVLSPKLKGSVTLYDVFREESLDFMMFFSSTNAILGNTGQCHYSAACSFQDAFAAWMGKKVPFPVKVMNWSFWGSTGAVATERYHRLLTEAGMLPIQTAEGMQLIEQSLIHPVTQLIIFKASSELTRKLGFATEVRKKVYLPKVPSIVQDVRLHSELSEDRQQQIDQLKRGFKELETFSLYLLLEYFWKSGCFQTSGECWSNLKLKKDFGIIPKYERLFDAMLDILERGGFISRIGEELVTTDLVTDEKVHLDISVLLQKKEAFNVSYPSLAPYCQLLWQCVTNYTEVLKGQKDYITVMFPDGSKELVQGIYQGNVILDYYNGLVAEAVSSYVQKRLRTSGTDIIRILEIGAGTGATSALVLDGLNDYSEKIEYVYTDVSASFTAHGSAVYGGKYKNIRFQVLDIEQSPCSQEFLPDSFDLILATNVLHATRSLEQTCQHIKEVLKTNGLLVINEITYFQNFSTLTFGLTDGWWNFEDQYRVKNSPLLSADAWKEVLLLNGFRHVDIYGLRNEHGVNDQSVILAEGDGTVILDGSMKSMAEVSTISVGTKEAPQFFSPEYRKNLVAPKMYRTPDLKRELKEEDLFEAICEYLIHKLSEKLKIDLKKIDRDTVFNEIGVDSLIIIELNKELERDFPKLPATLFFEYSTVEALGTYFTQEYRERLIDLFQVKDEVEPSSRPALQLSIRTPEKEDSLQAQDTRIGQIDRDILLLDDEETSREKDIAIIGLAGRYPLADNLDEYWDNLVNSRNCVTEIPAERWDWRRYYDPHNREQGKGSSKWGGFIRNVDMFDAELFQISEDHAREMDPQERLFLETTWSLLEDAGYPGQTLAERGEKVGVFVGVMYGAYGQISTRAWENGVATNAQSAYWLVANRTSHFFNFTGPSMAIDTACSSSLSAIHNACGSIWRGDCSMAIAGGINLILHPRQLVRLANLNNLSKSNQNRSFGEDGEGFVEGEGVGAVLLKPLDKAIQDQDYIYGVIKGTAVNNSGQSSTFTTPSLNAQLDVIEQSLQRARVNPETINYVDAHATGTTLGDPIEIRALSLAFSKYTDKKNFCSIGSIKSNLGHLEAASGISALTKVLLQMRYGKMVPTLHVDRLNPFIAFEDSPFHVQRKLSDWKRLTVTEDGYLKTLPRRAGISSFGAGGSNAHLIVEEYIKDTLVTSSSKPVLVVLSALTENSLRGYVKKLLAFIAQRQNSEMKETLILESIAYTLQTGRKEMKERLALVTSSIEELTDKLMIFLNRGTVHALFRGSVSSSRYPKIMTDNDGLETIARHWVNGATVHWETLYRSTQVPKRTPLPTYCFDRKSYWIQEEQTALDIVQPTHTATYNYDDPYLRDHVSEGKRTLLGVTYCSLAYEAFQCSVHQTAVMQVDSFLFQEPVGLQKEERVEIITNVEEEDGKAYMTHRFRYSTSEQVKTAAKGVLLKTGDIKNYSLSRPSFINQHPINGRELYNSKPGVYGPSLHTIQEVLVSKKDRSVWGYLKLTGEMKHGRQYAVHPALLDAAVLCRLALQHPQKQDRFIPLLVKRLCIFGDLPAECYCRVQEVKTNSEIWEGDIELTDSAGKVLVLMKGFVCKKLNSRNDGDGKPALERCEAKTMQESESVAKDLLNEVKSFLTDKIGHTMHISPLEFDPTCNFMDMGIQSSDLIRLVQNLQQSLGVQLYPTLFFEYPNVEQLALHIAQEYGDQFTKRVPSRQKSHLVPPEALAEDAQHLQEELAIPENEPIAIIGFSGYMPQSDDLNDFWNKLVQSECMVTEIPPDRWNWRNYYNESPDDKDKTRVIWGAFMKEVDKFDPEFFGISPREAKLMDPQHRLSLELVWKAIEDAGYNPRKLAGSNTGVFIGVAGHDYADVIAKGNVDSQAQALTGGAHNMLTGRISFLLDLHGPSEPIDTACSSSLVAIHRAVECLHQGECDLALAGGVNVIASPSLYISFDSVGILSPDGKCRTFDKDANGTVRGEGAGMLLLKPLSRAIRDRDHIYGLIRGTAVNHGGKASSLTAPNPNAQAEVIVSAYEKAGMDPGTVSYIEAHGTGTSLGDPVEINGLKRAFKKLYSQWNREYSGKHIAIGALKPNIGHLETASGVAGILKIITAMQHKTLPGIANLDQVNPYIQLEDTPFYLLEQTKEWERIKDVEGRELPFRAGISSFGFSGVNAHIVIEEYTSKFHSMEEEEPQLIVLSAHHEQELCRYADSLYSFIESSQTNASSSDSTPTSLSSDLEKEVTEMVARIACLSEEDLEMETCLSECGFDDPILLNQLKSECIKRFEMNPDRLHLYVDSSLKQLIASLALVVNLQSVPKGEGKQFVCPTLRQIAYTLQTGREALKQRLVIVAKDRADLCVKLRRYLNGIPAEYMYSSSTTSPAYVIDSSRSTIDMNAPLDLKLAKLDEIARLWVNGEKVMDWEHLYTKPLPNRVSLPTYPFSRGRYWVEPAEEQQGWFVPVAKASLTELIDSNESTLQGPCYKKTFSADDFYMREHVIKDHMLVPGVIYLEMARMAGELADPYRNVIGLSQVTWIQPVYLDTPSIDIWTSIHLSQSGHHFQMRKADGSLCSQGEIQYGKLPNGPTERLNLQEIIHRYEGIMEGSELYKLYNSAGFTYGPTFRPVHKLWFNSVEACSSIYLPEGLEESFHSFLLHPVLLEGALQTAGFLANRHIQSDSPAVPFGLGSIEIYGELPSHCMAYATFSNRATENNLCLDVCLLDDAGRVLVKIRDYKVRPIKKKKSESNVNVSPSLGDYKRKWS